MRTYLYQLLQTNQGVNRQDYPVHHESYQFPTTCSKARKKMPNQIGYRIDLWFAATLVCAVNVRRTCIVGVAKFAVAINGPHTCRATLVKLIVVGSQEFVVAINGHHTCRTTLVTLIMAGSQEFVVAINGYHTCRATFANLIMVGSERLRGGHKWSPHM